MSSDNINEVDSNLKASKSANSIFEYEPFFIKYPELLFFLLPDVSATNDYKTSNELSPELRRIYDAALAVIPVVRKKLHDAFPVASKNLLKLLQQPKQLEGKRAIELERTLCSIKNVMIISEMTSREEAYIEFTKIPTCFGEKITRQQFDNICDLMARYFSGKDVEILIAELVLGDLGKIPALRNELGDKFKIGEQDPDQFMEVVLHEHLNDLNRIFPCLKDLSKINLVKLVRTNTNFHYGHFAHAECTARELYKLKQFISVYGIENLYRNILVQIFDVSGAAAQNGKSALNALVAKSYLEDILPILENLSDSTPEQAYDAYLLKRLITCELKNEQQNLSQKKFLARVLCLFRVYDHATAERFCLALKDLSSNSEFQKDIITFDTYQASDKPKFSTPTYMPVLFAKLFTNPNLEKFGNSKEKTALQLGFKIIAKAMQCHFDGVMLLEADYKEQINPINFNSLAGLITTSTNFDEFIRNINNELVVNKKTGDVCLADNIKVTSEDFFISKPD